MSKVPASQVASGLRPPTCRGTEKGAGAIAGPQEGRSTRPTGSETRGLIPSSGNALQDPPSSRELRPPARPQQPARPPQDPDGPRDRGRGWCQSRPAGRQWPMPDGVGNQRAHSNQWTCPPGPTVIAQALPARGAPAATAAPHASRGCHPSAWFSCPGPREE
jgi:hypothetical protein